MTNDSFLFDIEGKRYILRINGVGSDDLLNRYNEIETYKLIKGLNIGEKIISIDADKGYKISCFIENVKACNPYAINDVTKCMKTLREFHSLKIKTISLFYGC